MRGNRNVYRSFIYDDKVLYNFNVHSLGRGNGYFNISRSTLQILCTDEKQCLLKIHANVSSVQLLSCVQLLVTPKIVAHQASLSITNSFAQTHVHESVLSSNHLILCIPFSSCLLSFPASGSSLRNQFFASGGQSIGTSALASVLPMNIQDWFPLGLLTGLIFVQSKGLSSIFSSTTIWKHQFSACSLFYCPTLTSIWLLEKP